MMVPAVGLFELMFGLLLGGSSLLGIPLGLPPGEFDKGLCNAVPPGALIQVEWAARSSGRPGANGLEGLVADPEVVSFLESVERAARGTIENNTPDPHERDLARNAIELATFFLNQPGCLFLSLATDDLPPREEFPNFAIVFERLQAGLILQVHSDADHFQSLLTKMARGAGLELPTALARFVLPVPVPGGGLTLHREGSRFILCYGQGTLDGVLAGLSGKRPVATEVQAAMTAWTDLAIDRPGHRTRWNIARFVHAADVIGGNQAMIRETVKTLGLDGVQSWTTVTGIGDEQGRIVSIGRLETAGQHGGLLSVFTGRSLRIEDLAHIPADADLVVAKSVPAVRVLRALRTIVSSANARIGEQFDAAVEELETSLGVSIEVDLPAAFGDVWTLYDSPSNGGVLLTAPVLCLEVRDPQKAYGVFTQFMQALEGVLPGEFRAGGRRRRAVYLSQQKFLDRTIYYINTIGEEMPLAPAFCVTQTHLLIAAHPQAIKGHLRFIEHPETVGTYVPPEEIPLGKGTLMFFSHVDTVAAARFVSAVLPTLGQLAAAELQSQRMEIDVFAVPSARGLLPYLSDSTSWIEVTENGVTMRIANGLGIPGLTQASLLLPVLRFARTPLRVHHVEKAVEVEAFERVEDR